MRNPVVAATSSPSNVVFDVDGCLLLDGAPIPGAADALAAVGAAGARVVIATNNSTRSPKAVAATLTDRIGVAIEPTQVLTSSVATASHLDAADDPVLVVGEDGLRAVLVDHGRHLTPDPQEAHSVVVGLDRSFDYDAMRRATHALALGARFLATNDDRTFPSLGPHAPGTGAILASIEAASGRRAEVCGKPYAPMLAALAPMLLEGSTWVVGDRTETDIAFARAGGFVAVLVLTGVTRTPRRRGRLRPDATMAGVGDLPAMLAQ